MVWHFDHLSAYMSRGAGDLWDGVKEQPCQNAEYHKSPLKKMFSSYSSLETAYPVCVLWLLMMMVLFLLLFVMR